MNRKDMTKQLIADNLKRLSASKPLDKITISDLVTACDINRSTFYYHFQDRDEVISWIFEHDITDCFVSVADGMWAQNVRHLLDVLQHDIAFYRQVRHIKGANDLNALLYACTVQKTMEGLDHPEMINPSFMGLSLPQKDKACISHFFAAGTVQLYMDFIENDDISLEEILKLLDHILNPGYEMLIRNRLV